MTGVLWTLQRLSDALSSADIPGGASADDVTKGIVILFFLVVREGTFKSNCL